MPGAKKPVPMEPVVMFAESGHHKSAHLMESGHQSESSSLKLIQPRSATMASLAKVLGPGLMVCLADSDIGGLFTMATAGAQTGYALLSLQLVLIPVLYVVQDMVVRLSVCRRIGLLALVHQEMGNVAAWILTAAMVLLGVCAMVSQFSGVAAVGVLFGLSPVWSCAVASFFLCVVILPGDYRKVERIGLCLGACLGAFFVTVLLCRPSISELALSILKPPIANVPASAKLGELVLANIGTVVTPWMLFYQASAIVEKRLTAADLPMAQLDTLCGSIITQLVMSAVLITFAVQAKGLDVESLPMGQVFMLPLKPLLGEHLTLFLMGGGLLGSSLLASLVVSLGVAWNLAEFSGSTIEEGGATRTPCFRVFFVLTVLLGALVVSSQWFGMVRLNILIQLVNGILMPLVVGIVFYLAVYPGILPEEHRIKGARSIFVAILVIGSSVGALRLAYGCLADSASL